MTGATESTFQPAYPSPNRVMSFIHEVRVLDRRWKNLSPTQKRMVLDAIGAEVDTEHILRAIKKARKTKCA